MGERATPLARALIAALLILVVAPARGEDINRVSLSGEAIEGYDPVAYYTTGQPQAGTRAFLYEWKGAVWRFASRSDRELFEADPERYQPAFGGYCAFAMSKGIKADIHPFAYAILSGKLYLFSTFESRDRFLANSDIRRGAEENWSLLAEKYF
jgi:YHS domain-containing protein